MQTITVDIVRYDNRKCYIHTLSRYINIAEIKDFIDAGYNVKVSKHSNGEDVTRQAIGELIKQSEGDLTNVYLFMLKRAV